MWRPCLAALKSVSFTVNLSSHLRRRGIFLLHRIKHCSFDPWDSVVNSLVIDGNLVFVVRWDTCGRDSIDAKQVFVLGGSTDLVSLSLDEV